MRISSDLTRAVKSFKSKNRGKKIGIVFDMRSVGKKPPLTTLDFIFNNYEENLEEANSLAELLMRADSVVCARSTPKQKAKIVNFVRKRGKVCLAIGDGANDVNMIRVSNLHFPLIFLGSQHRSGTVWRGRTPSCSIC